VDHAENEESIQVPTDVEPYSLIGEAVHNPTDALNVLLQVAELSSSKRRKVPPANNAPGANEVTLTPSEADDGNREERSDAHAQSPTPHTLTSQNAWKKCWLVRRGWLRPEEGAWYVTEYVHQSQTGVSLENYRADGVLNLDSSEY